MLACECSVRSLDFSPAAVFSLLLSFSLPAPPHHVQKRDGVEGREREGGSGKDFATQCAPYFLGLAPSPHWSLITPSTLLSPLSGTLVPADTLVPAVWAVLTLLILLVLLGCPGEPPSLGSLVLLLFP